MKNTKPANQAAVLMLLGLLGAVICAQAIAETPAHAANWKQIGNDTRIAAEAGSRVIDIDLDSIKRTTTETTVIERETQSSITSSGYSCREGDIRHGLTSKAIAAIFCRDGLPSRYPGRHEPTWVTYETKNANGEIWYTQYDSAGLYIIGHDMATSLQRHVTIRTMRVGYDCRGYYRLAEKWMLLDATDKIGGAPRGYVSPERQVSNWLCAK
jgi:hypothetical protein